MLTRLDLDQFKCFEQLRLPLNQLTLLSGTNAAGKSSILQALVLLHQTMLDSEWSTRLLLNGSVLQLGTAQDVIDKIYGQRKFGLGLVRHGHEIHWTFEGADRRAMSANVSAVDESGRTHDNPKALHFLRWVDDWSVEQTARPCIPPLNYLTAERLGPRETYALSDPHQVQSVGPRGENAVGMLYWQKDAKIMPALQAPDTVPTLLQQVRAWMQVFFPGSDLDVQQVPQSDLVSLGLRTSNKTGFHRPVHVGFGLTQVLPIIVAALSSKRDDLLLIENPEVHLHPAGQAMMGQFLAKVAAAGVQVILETHSDHVLNGVRRAVKSGIIAADQTAVHFFRDRDLHDPQVISPTIGPDGELDVWPEGFFDQFDKDMNFFAGWGE